MIKRIKKSRLIGYLYFGLKGFAPHLNHYRKYIEERDKLEIKLKENINKEEFFIANKCPCCSENSIRTSLKNPNGFNFDVCKNDGTIYLNPIPTEKTLSQFYQSAIHSFHWLKGRDIDNIIVEPTNNNDLETILLWAKEKKGGKLLDIGSSDGSFLLNAKEHFTIQGVELNQLTARIANNNGIPTFHGRIEDFYGYGEFDIISMLQVIEHIPSPKDFIINIRRLLKEDGLLYINTPNMDSSSFKFLTSRHEHVSSMEHVSLFNKLSLIETLAQCGFEVVEIDYCFGRDISLHDLISIRLSSRKFRHRMALYSPRLFYISNFFQFFVERLINWQFKGNESYVRGIFRKTNKINDFLI